MTIKQKILIRGFKRDGHIPVVPHYRLLDANKDGKSDARVKVVPERVYHTKSIQHPITAEFEGRRETSGFGDKTGIFRVKSIQPLSGYKSLTGEQKSRIRVGIILGRTRKL